MSRGIYILALADKGNNSYMQWAVNLAASVKYYSPDLHITLIHNGCFNSISDIEQSVFDKEVLMDKTDYYTTSFQPGLAKLSLYKYFSHEENIFIDADSILIDEIETLFDQCKDNDIALQVVRTANSKDEWECVWATWEQLKEFYGVEGNISEINSSFIYSKKTKEAAKFWRRSRKNFIDNLETKWAGKFPDELAFDAATSQTGITGMFEGSGAHYPVAMTSRIDGELLGNTGLKKHCRIISFWGGKNPNLAYHYKNYDLQANMIHREIFSKANPYKHQSLMTKKIVHQAGVRLLKQARLI